MHIRICAIAAATCVLICQAIFSPTVVVGQSYNPQQNNQQTNQQQFDNGQQQIQREVTNSQITRDPNKINAAIQQSQQPVMPEGFPLDEANQQWVDQLLTHWENNSRRVRAYKCDFRRWHYMPQFLNWRDPKTNKLAARMQSFGEIRFSEPDRGRYDVNQVYHFQAPEAEGEQPQYLQSGEAETRRKEKETWITDGKAIYEFDYINSRLNELTLPPDLQGEGLKNSPLPFVFGAKADDLKSRFWIRPMVADIENHYMIEAIPKTAMDARSYSKVRIVLSQQPFLPVRVEIFAVNYHPKTNPESVVLYFENRKINDPLQLAGSWMKKWFSKPATPVGWERFVGKIGEERPANPQGNNAQNSNPNLK